MKESRRYNVSVLVNYHHQGIAKMLSSVVKSPMDVLRHSITSFLSPDDGLLKPKRYNFNFLLYSILHLGFFFVLLIILHTIEFFSFIYLHVYIYIYRKRERERARYLFIIYVDDTLQTSIHAIKMVLYFKKRQ